MADEPALKALADGARRSLEASQLAVRVPYLVDLWRRRKWWFIGAALLILEAILMSTLGSTMGTHF